MEEEVQKYGINLEKLLSFPPEEVLEIIASQIVRHANSIEGFAVILSKEELHQEHNYAIQQIERQAKLTKSIIDVVWSYLAKRGYISETDDESAS